MPSSTKISTEISFLGTGDCGPTHGAKDGYPIERYSDLVRSTFAAADIRFGNCERQYSGRTDGNGRTPWGCQPPEMAQIFMDCKFDAVTIANNHMYDHGPLPLLDTRAMFLAKGIEVTGAGKDLAEARLPAIVERNGIRVGFLGYCSYFPNGGEAAADKVGIAPLRVKTYYEPRGPEAPARVWTAPEEQDLQLLLDDIASLREQVNIVMVALHGGVHYVPRVVSDYQVTAAHRCIDAGADLIMGHHPHILKGIEVYKGKAIFYSLGNFCITSMAHSKRKVIAPGTRNPSWRELPWMHGALRNHADVDPEYPLLPYGKGSERTMIAKAMLSKAGVQRVSFLPTKIDKQYRPEVLRYGDPRFDDIVDFMEWNSDGFDHRFTVDRDEVVITGS